MSGIIDRNIKALRDRIYLLVGRAVLSAVADAGKRQRVQFTALKGEVKDGVEHVQPYGFHAVPLPGAEVLFLSISGNRDHPVAVCISDPRYKPNWQPGESGLFTDEGDMVHLKRGRTIEITTDTLVVKATAKVRFETPVFEVTGDVIDNAANGGQTMLSMRETYNIHRHPENDSGGPTSDPNEKMAVPE